MRRSTVVFLCSATVAVSTFQNVDAAFPWPKKRQWTQVSEPLPKPVQKRVDLIFFRNDAPLHIQLVQDIRENSPPLPPAEAPEELAPNPDTPARLNTQPPAAPAAEGAESTLAPAPAPQSSAAPAAPAEEESDAFDLTDSLFGDEDPGFDLGGWVSFGYTSNSDGVINTVPDSFNNHQTWLYLDVPADGSEGLDLGFHGDLVYGIDGENTQSYGNNRGRWDFADDFDHGVYHWAIPQLYGVAAYEDLSVKIGHFYTLHGYEVVPANGNFFYSHAFTWNFSEPFTHTGALATYKVNDDLEIYGGWVAGWDTGFDRFDNSSAAQTGFKAKLTDDVGLIYLTTFGNNGWIGNGYTHSIVLDVALTDDLKYYLSSDLVSTDKGVFGGTTFNTVSAANYLIWQVADDVGVGARAEWFKIDGVSYYEVTFGLNFKPDANLTIRPEIRHNWCPSAGGGGGLDPLGIGANQTIFGIDVVFTF